MAPQKVKTDIPTEAKADQTVSDFESEGCTAVKTQQSNKKYTVIADCPEPAVAGGEGNSQDDNKRKVLRDIPPDRVGQVVSGFEAEGATTEKTEQADGNFTVVAKFS